MNEHLESLGFAIITAFGIILLGLGLWIVIPTVPSSSWGEQLAGLILMFLGFICITAPINYSQNLNKTNGGEK